MKVQFGRLHQKQYTAPIRAGARDSVAGRGVLPWAGQYSLFGRNVPNKGFSVLASTDSFCVEAHVDSNNQVAITQIKQLGGGAPHLLDEFLIAGISELEQDILELHALYLSKQQKRVAIHSR